MEANRIQDTGIYTITELQETFEIPPKAHRELFSDICSNLVRGNHMFIASGDEFFVSATARDTTKLSKEVNGYIIHKIAMLLLGACVFLFLLYKLSNPSNAISMLGSPWDILYWFIVPGVYGIVYSTLLCKLIKKICTCFLMKKTINDLYADVR